VFRCRREIAVPDAHPNSPKSRGTVMWARTRSRAGDLFIATDDPAGRFDEGVPPSGGSPGLQAKRSVATTAAAPLRAENLHVVRHVDPATGYVYTYYADASGQPVAGLSTSYSLQKASAGWQPRSRRRHSRGGRAALPSSTFIPVRDSASAGSSQRSGGPTAPFRVIRQRISPAEPHPMLRAQIALAALAELRGDGEAAKKVLLGLVGGGH
jgi:hypothetical protein